MLLWKITLRYYRRNWNFVRPRSRRLSGPKSLHQVKAKLSLSSMQSGKPISLWIGWSIIRPTPSLVSQKFIICPRWLDCPILKLSIGRPMYANAIERQLLVGRSRITSSTLFSWLKIVMIKRRKILTTRKWKSRRKKRRKRRLLNHLRARSQQRRGRSHLRRVQLLSNDQHYHLQSLVDFRLAHTPHTVPHIHNMPTGNTTIILNRTPCLFNRSRCIPLPLKAPVGFVQRKIGMGIWVLYQTLSTNPLSQFSMWTILTKVRSKTSPNSGVRNRLKRMMDLPKETICPRVKLLEATTSLPSKPSQMCQTKIRRKIYHRLN